MSDQESPVRVPDGQPDPVLVGPGLKALKEEAYTDATNATPSLDSDKKNQIESDTPSYFANLPGARAPATDPPSIDSIPEETRKKTSSGQDLLRRLSLLGDAGLPELDPRDQHPGLRLSGRLISAAFCIPYKLHFQPGSDWVRYPKKSGMANWYQLTTT